MRKGIKFFTILIVLCGCSNQSKETSQVNQSYIFPMKDGIIIQDFIGDNKDNQYVEIAQSSYLSGEAIASKDGVVKELGESKPSGTYYVLITHDDGLISYYKNLDQLPDLKVGQQIKQGTFIEMTSQTSSNHSLVFCLIDENGNRLKNTSSYLQE